LSPLAGVHSAIGWWSADTSCFVSSLVDIDGGIRIDFMAATALIAAANAEITADAAEAMPMVRSMTSEAEGV
jgi:hypothetical protein